MKNIRFLKLFLSIFICLTAGFIGSFFTAQNIASWYLKINKPSFTPPNWVFAPVWTTLFILMGISLYLVWDRSLKKRINKEAIVVFFIQFMANIFWSFLFFFLHKPLLAFFDIIILWFSILLTIIKFNKISKPAALLLVPYLLWVSFASFLNFFVYQLNR